MPEPRRSRLLPPASPDASGVGVLGALTALLILTIAFVGTDGGIVDSIAAVGAPSGAVLGAVATPRASALAVGSIAPSLAPSPSPSPAPSPSPSPVRAPLTVNLLTGRDPKAVFVSETTSTLCAAAAVQMTVELVTGRPDRSATTQRRIHALETSLTSHADSRNGGTGPLGMAAAISRLTGVRYELRTAATRTAAVRGAAATLRRTGRPIVLLAWRGAHAWVMTGFRADADPAVFTDATIGGAYVLDPWYPRVSRIWGPSDPPNTFQDAKELVRNYLAWKRPEGRYPGRDGRFLYLAPVEPAG